MSAQSDSLAGANAEADARMKTSAELVIKVGDKRHLVQGNVTGNVAGEIKY